MAKGKVTRVNPPMNAGSIQIDGGTDEYNYNVKAGQTVGGYVPQLGDNVNFTEGSNHVATGVSKIIAPPIGCTLAASPDSVGQGGGRVTLTWTTIGAVKADIQPGVGPVDPAGGSTPVEVKVETTFVLTTVDAAGKADKAFVTVFIV